MKTGARAVAESLADLDAKLGVGSGGQDHEKWYAGVLESLVSVVVRVFESVWVLTVCLLG